VTPHSISELRKGHGYLISKSLRGGREASNVLLSRYRQLLDRLAYRVLRNHEDSKMPRKIVAPGVFELPAFKHEGAFRGWLARILFHEAVNILRQRRHPPSSSVEPISFEQPVAVRLSAALLRK